MDMNLIVKAKKDGQMDNGIYFCYKNEIYHAAILDGDEEDDGDFYYVDDEHDGSEHGMDKEFFDEYFEVMAYLQHGRAL